MHDDAAYVPAELFERWGEQDPVRRFEAWMREHAGLARRRARRRWSATWRKRSPRPSHAPRRAPGPIRTRSKMASTPAEAASALALPRYRPGSTTSCAAPAPCSCAAVFRMRAEGVENMPARGRRRARPDASLVLRHARRRRADQAAALPRHGQVRALPGAVDRARDRARRRLPGAGARCRTWRPTRPPCGSCARASMLLVFPEGTRNRDGNARPQLGAARLAIEAGAALRAGRRSAAATASG